MEMVLQELEGGITRIGLAGDLDAKGAGEIDLRFQAVAAGRDKVVVDLSQVGFLASIGIRTLIMAAKAQGRRGGRLVVLDPHPEVEKVLLTCGVDALLPILFGLDAALAHLA
jgi:anti-anti-sigma factor